MHFYTKSAKLVVVVDKPRARNALLSTNPYASLRAPLQKRSQTGYTPSYFLNTPAHNHQVRCCSFLYNAQKGIHPVSGSLELQGFSAGFAPKNTLKKHQTSRREAGNSLQTAVKVPFVPKQASPLLVWLQPRLKKQQTSRRRGGLLQNCRKLQFCKLAVFAAKTAVFKTSLRGGCFKNCSFSHVLKTGSSQPGVRIYAANVHFPLYLQGKIRSLQAKLHVYSFSPQLQSHSQVLVNRSSPQLQSRRPAPYSVVLQHSTQLQSRGLVSAITLQTTVSQRLPQLQSRGSAPRRRADRVTRTYARGPASILCKIPGCEVRDRFTFAYSRRTADAM